MRTFLQWLVELHDFESHPVIPKLTQSKIDLMGKYKVVVVDVEKFDAAWSRDSNAYLPTGGEGKNYIPIHGIPGKPDNYNRYHRVGEEAPRFKTDNKLFQMSTVGIRDGRPTFIDGRHRFAYFRDLGVKTLPVSVPLEDYHSMQKLFGVN